MKFLLARQSIGKRRPQYSDYEVEGTPQNLEELLVAMIRREVARFNEGPVGEDRPLTDELIWLGVEVGTVRFGTRYNETKVDVNEAIEVGLLAYKDELYKVFIDGEEVEGLETAIELGETSKVLLMRLTFLTGRMW